MSLVLARHFFIVMWVRIILILFIQRRISLHWKRERAVIHFISLFSSLETFSKEYIPHSSSHVNPPDHPNMCPGRDSEIERERPWARDSTFTKVSLCLHHPASPRTHTRSLTQPERNLAGTHHTSHPDTLMTLSCLVTRRHEPTLKRLARVQIHKAQTFTEMLACYAW